MASPDQSKPRKAPQVSLRPEGAPSTATTNTTSRFVFKGLPVTELVKYVDEIKRLLPPLALKDLDLEEELLMQFHSIRAVQNDVLNDDSVPVNQRAQVANSVGTVLSRLSDLQVNLYTSERFKRIEGLLIRMLRKMPNEEAKKFLDDYEALLEQIT